MAASKMQMKSGMMSSVKKKPVIGVMPKNVLKPVVKTSKKKCNC